jgi:hypothetical protein
MRLAPARQEDGTAHHPPLDAKEQGAALFTISCVPLSTREEVVIQIINVSRVTDVNAVREATDG